MSDDLNKIKLDNDENGAEATDEAGVDEMTDMGGYEAVKGLIQRMSVQLDELKEKQKDLRERLKNIQDNDAQLGELEIQAKEAATAFKKRKKDLMDSLEAREVKAKLTEANEEAKEIKESLTHHLLNYYQITGTQSFETPAGGEREFSFAAKIKPAKK